MPTSRVPPSASLKWRAKSSRSRPTDPARNSPSAWLKALSPNLAHIRTLLPPAHRNIIGTLKILEGRARLRVTKFGDTENDRFLFRVLNAHVRFGPTAANQPKPSDVSYEPIADSLLRLDCAGCRKKLAHKISLLRGTSSVKLSHANAF